MPDRWFAKTISQTITLTGYIIVLTTDVPCHLWLYYTYHKPWVHRAATITRGLSIPWGSYWCYVSWYIIEQEEAGDTLTHTFHLITLVNCDRIWFRFHGTIAAEDSPSDSPILFKHYQFPPPDAPYFFDYKSISVADYNASWVACSFLCLKTGTPTKLGIWLWNYGARNFDMKLYIEQSVNQPPGIVAPFDSIDGQICCYGFLPAAQINAHTGVFWYHEVELLSSSPLTAGHYYIFSSNDQDATKAYRYRVHNIHLANDSITYWQDGQPNYPVRNWTRYSNLPVKAGRLS